MGDCSYCIFSSQCTITEKLSTKWGKTCNDYVELGVEIEIKESDDTNDRE